MLVSTRTLLVMVTISFGARGRVSAKQMSADSLTDDTDENLMLKICHLKFCTSVNQIVSSDRSDVPKWRGHKRIIVVSFLISAI